MARVWFDLWARLWVASDPVLGSPDLGDHVLAFGLASEGVGQEATQALFGALARELPQAQRDRVMAHAARAVIAWQQASRSQGQVH